MIVRLDQKTRHAKWGMHEFHAYAFHESVVTVLRFDVSSSIWVQSLAQCNICNISATVRHNHRTRCALFCMRRALVVLGPVRGSDVTRFSVIISFPKEGGYMNCI